MDLVTYSMSKRFTQNNSIAPKDDHLFDNVSDRDAYFTDNPAEKTSGLYVTAGTQLQQWDGTEWIDRTQVVRGEQGPRGEGTSAEYNAAVGGVNAGQVLYINTLGTVQPANSDNITHAGKVLGFASESKSEGEDVLVLTAGDVTKGSWTLSPGLPAYLAAGGDVTQTPPDEGFSQRVGVATTATTINIRIGEPVVFAVTT